MAIFLAAPRSISLLVVSVGCILLSIMVASLLVNYNPTSFTFGINGYSTGLGTHQEQPPLDTASKNQTEAPVKSPDISEQGKAIVKNFEVSFEAQVPAFAPTLSIDENHEMAPKLSSDYEKYNSGLDVDRVAYQNQTIAVEVRPLPPSADDNETFGFDSGAEMPQFAPTLPADGLQEVENASDFVSVNGHESKESNGSLPSLSADHSLKEGSRIGGNAVASLNLNARAMDLPSTKLKDDEGSQLKNCDLYQGKWIYDPTGPLYTNNTCPILAQPQNCQGNGRPDKDYENWRWKPNQCHLPRFDGKKFLELMRNKTLAFVGDSLTRNQMESLLCMLWQTEVPINHGTRKMHKWHFQSTSTTIVRIWSAWLVRKTPLPVPSASPRAVIVHLEAPDESFMQFLPEFNVLVLSSGHWFSSEPTYLVNGENPRRQLRRTKRPRKSDTAKFYHMALQTALKAITSVPDYAGLTILRSYSPEHYSSGAWNSGGSCAGINKPASKSLRSSYAETMRKEQIAAIERAAKEMKNRSRLRLMDITEMSGYRSDGHAGPYRDKVAGKVRNGPQDCVHWCMPGPVDTWNEVLFEILKREM